MPKFLIYSDGGSRGNPGPAAFGFIIKPNAIFNFPSGQRPLGRRQFSIFKQIPNLNVKIQNNIVYGSGYLGETTNNQAEYNGILAALKSLQVIVKPVSPSQGGSEKLKVDEVECYLDSELIVRQLKGEYKIKNEGLKPLYWQIRELIMEFGGKVSFNHIPREQNTEADRLVNEAIDEAVKSNIKCQKSE